jgi:hypothetical protein
LDLMVDVWDVSSCCGVFPCPQKLRHASMNDLKLGQGQLCCLVRTASIQAVELRWLASVAAEHGAEV